MTNLNTSNLKDLDYSVERTESGWQITFGDSVIADQDYQLHCERLAGRELGKAISLQHMLASDGRSASVSYEALQALSGAAVDRYAHPVFTLTADPSESAGPQVQLRLAARPIPMSVTANFRDYGGHLTQDGRQVVWGRLFRTGHMGEMSEADKQAINQLDIAAVCDFRRQEEAANQPSQLPEGLEPTSIVISPGSSIDLFSAISEEGIQETTIDAFMQEINRDLVHSHQASYRKMFDLLLAHAGQGSIIHCSAGKDRTGFGGLLVLGALGVDRQSILNDYLLTNQYVDIDREIARWTRNYGDDGRSNADPEHGGLDHGDSKYGQVRTFNRDALAVILRVKASYLQAAMDAIDSRYGGLERYLDEQIGLSAEELRALKHHYLY